nr:octanoyltransferase [Gemmatimonadota bacterium]
EGEHTPATLTDALGRRPTAGEVAGALGEGFRRVLGAELEPDELDRDEERRVETWRAERYAADSFLYRC